MLRTLRIRNLVIVDDLTVEFGPGLNLLTGETGAGKSILIDALGIAVGGRADRSAVRHGEGAAIVEALFDVASRPDVAAWLDEHGLDPLEEGELVLRREISATTNHRAWINGSPCTQRSLRDLGSRLLQVHGQHEQQTLLQPERHLELVDRWGGHDDAGSRVRDAFEAVREQQEQLATLRQETDRRDEELERLARAIEEIDAVEPVPGERDALDLEREQLRHAGSLVAALDQVVALSHDSEPAAATLAARAARAAAQVAALVPELEEPARRIEGAALDLEDAGADFRRYRDQRTFDPARLETIEERRAALDRLTLRYGKDEDEVLAWRDEARARQAELGSTEERIREAEQRLSSLESAYRKAAAALTRARRRAADGLVPAILEQLAALSLAEARIEVAFTPARGETIADSKGRALPLARRGAERAEFLLASNPGEPARPLSRVASGGELSRIMLALHAVLAPGGGDSTLIFDEVDTGVGGAVADAIGARLKAAATVDQVLCVTHLAQVAAYADRHLVVSKRVSGERTRAGVRSLDRKGRVDELARMLAGNKPTAALRKHAGAMLDAHPGEPAR